MTRRTPQKVRKPPLAEANRGTENASGQRLTRKERIALTEQMLLLSEELCKECSRRSTKRSRRPA